MRYVVGAAGLVVLLVAALANAQESPVAAMSGVGVTVSDEIRAMFREWFAARRSHDREALERLYAPEFVAIHAYGYIDDRATQIEIDLATDPPQDIPEEAAAFRPSDDPLRSRVAMNFADVAVRRIPAPTSDGAPAMGTIIFVKRNGRWQFLQMQGTEMVQTAPPVKLGHGMLERFVGRYRASTGRVIVLSVEAGQLRVGSAGFPKRPLTPTSETQFFDNAAGSWTFYPNADGTITRGKLFRRGREVFYDRIE